MTDARFDHRDLGTPEAQWPPERLNSLPQLSMPAPDDHVVVLAAHPDDETLGAGGLIHQARRCGARVTVVVGSDGEGSHPDSPTATRRQLAPRRRAELLDAVRTLGPDVAVHALGLPDGDLTSFVPALDAAVDHLAGDATLLVAPWSGDRHPDHTAVSEVAHRAADRHGLAVWEYPIWLWHWAAPDDPEVPWGSLAGLALSSGDLAAKSAALRRYVSQLEPLSDAPGDEPVVDASMTEHFHRRVEAFVVTPAAVEGARDATDPAYFAALYARADDPWGLASRFYEQRKRSLLMATLPREHFGRVFEAGCATGLLTAELAGRSDEVVAWDVAESAVKQTRERLDGLGYGARATVAAGHIPHEWPEGRFDLVVISEVGYYCTDLDDLVRTATASLADGGLVVACHWRHRAPDHPHGGDDVHEAFGRRMLTVAAHVEEDFLLHVWGHDHLGVVSPARREGIVG